MPDANNRDNELVTTGVDGLITLVKKAKRISFEDAAKKLGMPINTIEAWASFLEEEGAVSIDYKFTTPYLLDKSLNAPTGDKEFIEVKSMIDKVKKNIEDGKLDDAKETYYEIIENLESIHKDFGEAAIKKDPELNSIIKDKLGDIREAINSAEGKISRGGEEESVVKDMTKLSLNIKTTTSHMKAMRNKIGKVKPKKPEPPPKPELPAEETTPEPEEEEKLVVPDIKFTDTAADEHLRRAYELIKLEKFKSAKAIYGSLQSLLDKMPQHYIERKRELNNDLIKLNRDLEVNFEKKYTSEMNRLARKTNKSLSLVQTLISKGEIKKAEKELEGAEGLIDSIPDEFLQVKTDLETKLLYINEDLIRKRQELYSIDFQKKTTKIIELLSIANDYLKKNASEEAKRTYDEAKKIFTELPEGFIQQKLAIQNRLMEVYTGVLLSEEKSSIDKMKSLSSEINRNITETMQLIKSGNLTEAMKSYDELSSMFNKLPEGFLNDKTALQDEIIDVHRELITKKSEISTKDMEAKSAKAHNLLKIAESYISKKQYDLANEIINELTSIYASLPEGFFHKKIEIHTKILDLSKRLMIESDRTFLSETDDNTKAKYNILLKLIVKFHEHVEIQEFNLLETTFRHIIALFNELPVGFVSHSIRITREIQKIKNEVDLYRKVINTSVLIKQNNIPEAKRTLDLVSRTYPSVANESREDIKLLEHIKHTYDICKSMLHAAEIPELKAPEAETIMESFSDPKPDMHVFSDSIKHRMHDIIKTTKENHREEIKEDIKEDIKKPINHEQALPAPTEKTIEEDKDKKDKEIEDEKKKQYRIDSLKQHILYDISKGNFNGALYNLKELLKLDKERIWIRRMIRFIEKKIIEKKTRKKPSKKEKTK